MLETFDPNDIQDLEGARQAVIQVLNLVEEMVSENRTLREENQRLRDENNRLKGEQGKPLIKPNTKPKATSTRDHSSEPARRQPKKRTRHSKVQQIHVDRECKLDLDRTLLPEDAAFKEYVPVIVQDVRLITDNVRFLKEKRYSSSLEQTYLAELPAGYEGEFGPGVKALSVVLYHAVNTSEPKIIEFFEHIGVYISSGQVSNLLIKHQDRFHAEKDAVYEAGLRSSPWQHSDETGTRVNGVNQHCHVMCNPLYTAYLTTEKKDRLTVIDVLSNLRSRQYRLLSQTYEWLLEADVSPSVLNHLRRLPQDQVLDDEQFSRLLDEHLADVNAQSRRLVLEAAAITAYQTQQEIPVVRLLICDDAAQFKRITEELALCWVHDARHYNKLAPVVDYHRRLLDEFMDRYWAFYHSLTAYRQNPDPAHIPRLEDEFDDLFSTVSGYVGLDRRIEMTRDKKPFLLAVLRHPEIALHNNPAEIEMRRRVRKRDVSYGPRTQDGKRAWDTFATLLATTQKLGVSFYRYIYDRISEANEIPCLADLIDQRAQQLNLGASWATT
jgi:regulator of replication initiation timing